MTTLPTVDLNLFLSGHLIVDENRNIIYCNAYMCDLSDVLEQQMINSPLSQHMTKASNIFVDSYIYPLLINEALAEEIQLTWSDEHGKKTPIIANIKLGDNGLSYWSMYICTNRDKLQTAWLEVNKKLEEQSEALFKLATTDPLTGLLNRRELQVQAEKIIHQADRNSSTFALMTIDIDFFKVINDKNGHEAGDNVLIDFAHVLTKNRRLNDLVARVGGEEFILILPDIDEKNAFKFAEKLRVDIENRSINNIKITVSIGLVVTQKKCKTDLPTLLRLSDNALYQSKNEGRNKTSVSQIPNC